MVETQRTKTIRTYTVSMTDLLTLITLADEREEVADVDVEAGNNGVVVTTSVEEP